MTGKSLSFALEDSKKETNLKEMMKREVEDKLSSSQGNCSGLMVNLINELNSSINSLINFIPSLFRIEQERPGYTCF